MMIVLASQNVNVKGNTSGHCERVEYMRYHFGGKFANLLSLQVKISYAVWSSRDINDRAR